MPNFVAVAKKSEIPENGALCVQAEGNDIALFNVGGEIFAIDDACPHEGGPLSDGDVDGDVVECPWHASRFNIRTGKVLMDPAESDVTTYNVRVSGDTVEVEI